MRRYLPLFIMLAIIIPVVAYLIMHGVVQVVPLSEDNFGLQLFLTLFVIGLGVTAPYLMLKTAFFSAHLKNSEEKELHLRDIPKDKRQAGK
ncbi:hypothetical protein GC177_06185 [bacterium]|nr:hypothetical protein [bacterium]